MAIGEGVLGVVSRTARVIRHPVLAGTVMKFAYNNGEAVKRLGGAGRVFDVACRVTIPKRGIGEEYGWHLIVNFSGYAPYSRMKTMIAASILADRSAAAQFTSGKRISVSSIDMTRTAYDDGKPKKIKEDLDYKDTIDVFNLRSFCVGNKRFRFSSTANQLSHYGNRNQNFIHDWAWVGWQY